MCLYTHAHMLQISSPILLHLSFVLSFVVSQLVVISDFESQVPRFDEADITLSLFALVVCVFLELKPGPLRLLGHKHIVLHIFKYLSLSSVAVSQLPQHICWWSLLHDGKGHLVPRSQGSPFGGILRLFLLQGVQNFFSSNLWTSLLFAACFGVSPFLPRVGSER